MVGHEDVYCHPSENSFTKSMCDAFIKGVVDSGNEYILSDLYKMGFQTDMTEEEYQRDAYYRDTPDVADDVLAEQEKIYALHHFPDIEHSIGEVSRVLTEGGLFFISDPCPNECDTERFVDDYMQLKKDGHIKFYTKDEWVGICGKYGMHMMDSFESTIRFPKKKDTAIGYEEVLRKHDKAIIASYDLVETETELYVTERVNNILFVKK